MCRCIGVITNVSFKPIKLVDILGLLFDILYFMFCVYKSNRTENPIHLLHCLTPPEQGCGELFALDKNNGKVTGVPNHRVKNISLHVSCLRAVGCSVSSSNCVANKAKKTICAHKQGWTTVWNTGWCKYYMMQKKVILFILCFYINICGWKVWEFILINRKNTHEATIWSSQCLYVQFSIINKV